MRASLLIVAALYQLVSKGEKFLSDSKLPVCENIEGFQNINAGSTFGSFNLKKIHVERYFKQKMTQAPSKSEEMKIEQANNILLQMSSALDSKFWETNKNMTIISSSYTPESKEFSFYLLNLFYNKSRDIYIASESTSRTKFAGFKRFQSTSYFTGEESSDSSFLDNETTADPDELIAALQISLLPYVLFNNNDFMERVIMPIVEISIKQIEKGDFPYGVNEANKEDVKQKLLSIVNDGFPMEINSYSISQSLNEKCK